MQSPTSHGGRFLLAVTAVALALGAWFLMKPATPANAVAIVPARWTFVDPAGLDAADERLAEAITAQAIRHGKLPMVPWRAIRPFQAQPKQAPELARETGATRVMAVSVKLTGAQSRVTVFLAEPFTGRKLWAEDFYAQDLRTPEAVQSLAETIVHDMEVTLGAGS